MGDNNTGGGGSVRWSITANNLKAADGTGDGPHHLEGHDIDGEVGASFTVSIRVPNGYTSAQAYKKQLKLVPDGKRIYFNLPIENRANQIRVSWGKSRYHRGEGRKKRAATPKR